MPLQGDLAIEGGTDSGSEGESPGPSVVLKPVVGEISVASHKEMQAERPV